MRKYVERMLQEKTDLKAKIKKAVVVLENVPFDMDKTQVMLLAEQVKIMKEYERCLLKRIDYENTKE